jgi:L-2-hydroxyglutarate oxidase
LSTATALAELRPGASILVLDKEPDVAAHQTGHNSGVLHSGLYYKPGSLKARLCVEGQRAMGAYCETNDIPFRRCGKVVIASHPHELPAMDELFRRGTANGLRGLRRLAGSELAEFEPHAVGVAAIHVPESGIVDYVEVARSLARNLPGDIVLGDAVDRIRMTVDGAEISTGSTIYGADVVVNCAGLHSDRVARMAGLEPPVQIVPFRGEYYTLTDEGAALVNALVYPVPDPRFPFLGVHFTRKIDGSVEVGPNAVPALGREHYRDTRPNWSDVVETVGFRGIRPLVRTYWRTGAAEAWRSARRSTYAKSAQTLIPEIVPEHLRPGGAGIRAQALTAEGKLVDDFEIVTTDHAVHVLNAPSPAATAALAIGRHIAGLVTAQM